MPPRLGVPHGDEVIRSDAAFVFRPFVRREFPFVRVLGQRLEARLQLFGRLEVRQLPDLLGREQPQQRIGSAINRRCVISSCSSAES